MMVGEYFHYFVDNESLTGIQYLPSREDPSVKLYYEFEEDGALIGTVTGLFELDGDLYYAIQGKRMVGWQSMYDRNGNAVDYYFDRKTGKAVDGAQTVEGYDYIFTDHILTLGDFVTDATGIRYRWAGLWMFGRWFEAEGKLYHTAKYQTYLTTGWSYIVGQDLEYNWHLFDENGVFQKDYSGKYDRGEDTYLLMNGVLVQEPGLVLLDDGYYYYFCSTGKAVKNRTYWPSKTNGLLPYGPYHFDELGRMTNPRVVEPELPEPEQPGQPSQPSQPSQPEQPPQVKDGLVKENGGYFYYKNGALQYAAGLIKLGEDYYYIRSNAQAATGNYWVTNPSGLRPAGMYTFGPDGKMLTGDEEVPTPPAPEDTLEQPKKDGMVSERGAIYYYKDGAIQYCAGIIYVDGYYYYVRSNGQLATGSYWPTKTNDLLPQGMYNFDEQGRMTNPPGAVEPEKPDSGETPVEPEKPQVKQGIIEENGILYFYENGTRAYNKGIVKLTDDSGRDYYIYVRSNGQLATGNYWPTNTNGLLTYKGYDWGTDGRLYL